MARSLLFGPYRIDLAGKQLWRGEDYVELPPRAMDVLIYLAERAGQVITREELFEALWPAVHVADHALSVQIADIRKALGDDVHHPLFVETRHRRGYRFKASVEAAMDTAGGAFAVSAAAPARAHAPAFARPETQYVESGGGVNIAYQVIGDGPVDLVFVAGWVSHLEYGWTEPRFARFLQRLSSFSRVILFDKRGTGLSDRVPLHDLPTIEQRMEDVHAVMDSVGSERAFICGISEGGCMSAVFAATYSERAAGLIMIGTYARRLWAPDYPWAPTAEQRQVFFDQIRSDWGGPVGLEERAPSVAPDPQFREWWATYLRMGASPGAALALTRMNTETDIRDVLPHVRVPTLVLHRSGDRCLKVEEGRYIASQIPGARFIELPGEDHLPFVGDQDSLLQHIEEFITQMPRASERRAVLGTALLAEFHEISAAQAGSWLRVLLERWGSRSIDESGPRVAAAFQGPVRALQCARALQHHARSLHVPVRIGLHTGELVSRHGSPLAGSAILVARQIVERAGWDQVLASGTLRDLVAGSGIRFVAQGRVEAEGLGEWQLLEVVT